MGADEQPAVPNVISRSVVLCLLLALVAVAVFFPAHHFEFLNYDDPDYFTANRHVLSGLSGANIAWAFTTNAAANWHPLTWLSLMFDAELFGKNPAGPHLVNVLFHAANTVLLFLLLRRLTSARWRSAVVAALFALHPLHVESVAWVSERKDVLSAFFGLLTLLCYARGKSRVYSPRSTVQSLQSKVESRGPTVDSGLWTADSGLALSFFTLGLMSKPMLVTLPFVMLLLDFWPLQRFNGLTVQRLLLEKIPFFALSAAVCAVTYLVQKGGGAFATHVSVQMRMENAFVSYVRYLGKTFWPSPLATPYPYPDHWEWWLVIGSIAVVVGLTVAAAGFRRQYPFFFVGWFWFVGMLVPVIGLVPVGEASMADRYTYLPLVGLFIALVWAMAERLKGTCLAIVVAVVVLAACGWRTGDQLRYWQSSGTLFSHALAVTQNNYIACDDLGTWLSANGRVDEAMDCFKEALRIKPDNVDAMYNLGNVYARRGQWDDAIAQYSRALETGPPQSDILANLGVAFAATQRFPEAIQCYQRALELKPDSAEVHNNLATMLFQQGRFDQAAEHFQKAVQLAPDQAQFHINLADTWLRLGRTNDAANSFKQALELQPENERVRRKLQSLQK